MANATHTPGPWGSYPTGRTMRKGYRQPYAIAQKGTANMIAGLFGDVRGGPDVAEANGRLIEAAPELLEALKAMTSAFKPFTLKPIGAPGSDARAEQDAQAAAFQMARAVISKIENGEG